MVMKNCNNQSIQQYMSRQKTSFYTSLLFCAIVLVVTILFCYKMGGNIRYLLLFEIVVSIFIIIDNLELTIILNNIQKYAINSKIEEETKDILYWNHNGLWLTNNYVIINKSIKVFAFQYKDIKKIKKKEYYTSSGVWATPTFHRDLEIELHSGQKYKVRMYNQHMEFKEVIEDVTPILLEKNKNIIEE